MGRRVISARRPKHYFGNQRALPEVETLELGFPKVLEVHYGARDKAQDAVTEALNKHASAARQEIKRKGWVFLGKEGAQKVDHLKQATSWGVFDRGFPRLATLGLSRENAKKVREELKAWTERYYACRQMLLEGARDILWPFGTWAMVQNFGMEVEAAPFVA